MNGQKTVAKTVKKYGNSGGVYLPASWIGGEVEVRLVKKSPVPEKDILLAFSDEMKHVISIFMYGSYARKEQAFESDIDVIVVTDMHANRMEIPEKLKGLRYDIRMVSRKEIMKAVEKDALLRKSLEDSTPILNGSFLDELLSIKPNLKTLANRISFAESSLEIVKSIHKMGGKNPDLIYPIIMRIKEMLLIRCIPENKGYSLGLLEDEIRKKGVSKSDFEKLMKHYRAVRDGKKPPKYDFSKDALSLLIELLGEMIKDARKEEKGKKGH